MEYEEVGDYDQIKTQILLESNKESEVIQGLLSLVFYSCDYSLSLNRALFFSSHKNTYIKSCAIECFGHIARIHKKLDLKKVKPILKENKTNKNLIIKGKCIIALDDIEHFLKIKISFQ